MNSLLLSVVARAAVTASALRSTAIDPVALYAGVAVVALAGWALLDYRRRAWNARRFAEALANQSMQPCKPASACAQLAARRASAA